MGPGVFYSWNFASLNISYTLKIASMGPGVFYSWNGYSVCGSFLSGLCFNGARSFLLLEYCSPVGLLHRSRSFNGARSFLLLESDIAAGKGLELRELQWGQEFFTPGIRSLGKRMWSLWKASMGPGVFYSWNYAHAAS